MKRIAVGLCLGLLASPAAAFDITFDWTGVKPCTSGNPRTIASPRFVVKDVPEGTTFIRLKMIDRDYRNFSHGGGTVAWAGGNEIPAGAFRYKSPCPPNGAHTYEWTATALAKKSGGKLGEAKASRDFPE